MSDLSNPSAKRPAAADPTLRDMVAPLFRWRRLLVLCFVGIFSGGVLSAIFLPKQYEARMEILVKRERVDPIVTTEATSQGAQAAPAVTEEEINSEVEILRSHDLLTQVVLARGLQVTNERSLFGLLASNDDAETQVSRAVDQLDKKLHVEALAKTDLIEITYRSPDRQLSHRVLETLANLYLEKHLAVHRPPGALDFFQQETEQYRSNLEHAEDRLSQFSKDENVAFAQTERDMTLQKLNDFDTAYHQTQADIAETRSRVKNLEAQLSVNAPRLPTLEKSTDDAAVLQVLEGTLSSLELKHTDMASHFAPGYLPLKDIEAQIAQVQEQLAEVKAAPVRENATDANPAYLWLTEELAKSTADLATLQAREAAASKNMQLYRQMTLQLAQKQLEQEDLIREAKVQEGNYLLYLNKREEARISDALDNKRIVNVAIAEAPTLPALPIRSPWFFVMLGTLMASVGSVTTALVADSIDPSLRTVADVERVLQLPILAAVPKSQIA